MAMRGVSHLVAIIILVAIVVVTSIALAGWLMGIYLSYTRLKITFQATVYLQTTRSKVYYPFQDYMALELWAERDPSSGHYKVWYKITFLKPGGVHVKMELFASDGQHPDWAANPVVDKTEHVDPWDYVEDYWAPIKADEFPLRIDAYFEYSET